MIIRVEAGVCTGWPVVVAFGLFSCIPWVQDRIRIRTRVNARNGVLKLGSIIVWMPLTPVACPYP